MVKKIFLFLLAAIFVTVTVYGMNFYRQKQPDNFSSSGKISRNTLAASASDHAGVPLASGQSTTTNQQTAAANKNAPDALAQIHNEDAHSDNANAPADAAAERYRQLNNNSQYPTLATRIAALEALYPQQFFEPNELVDLLAEPNAWQSADVPPQQLPLTAEQRSDGRAFIELKPERLLVTLPGDLLELPIEQLGSNLQMQVERRELLPSGGFILHGQLTDTNEVMRVTLTQTPGLSLAGIETPQGHYVLQANDGQGWIASSDTLFKQSEQHDMVTPPEHENNTLSPP